MYWNTAFREYMESIEFKQSAADPCVYIQATNTIIVGVYVDDMIVITKTAQEMQRKDFGSLIQDEGHGKTSLLPWNQYRTNEDQKCMWIH